MTQESGKTLKILSSLAVVALLSTTVAAPSIVWARSSSEKSIGYLDKAREYVKKGNWRTATIELKNALQADPDNVDARILLGDVYIKTYNGPSAEKEYRAARKRGAKDDKILLRLGQAYELQRKYDDILKEIKLDDVPSEQASRVYLLRGSAYLGLKQVDDAVAAYQKAEKLAPENAEVQNGLSRVYLLKKDMPKAEQSVDKALKLEPRNLDALLIKAEILRIQNKFDDSLKYLSTAVDVAPNYLPALLGRASVLVELKRDDEARADLDRVYKIAPDHPTAHYLAARIKWRDKDIKGANEELQKAGAALDNFIPAVFLNGLVNFALGNMEQAAFYLSRVIEYAPGHVGARRVLGMTLLRQNELDKAIQVLKPVADKGTDDARVYSMLGYAYMRKGDLEQGSKYFDMAVAADPEESSNRTRQAVGRLALGDYDSAVDTLEGVLKKNPKSVQASAILVMAELRHKDYAKALAAARDMTKRIPDNAAGPYLEGQVYMAQGKLEEARSAYERAAELNDTNISPATRLAQIDYREGKKDSAVARYRDILKRHPDHVPSMMALASLAGEKGDTNERITWLQKAVEASDTDMRPALELIDVYVRQREFEKAKAVANRLTQAHPDKGVAFEALGKVLAASGDKEGAIASFERLTGMQPNNPGAYHLLGRVEVAADQLDAAHNSYEKALDLAKAGELEKDAARLGTPATLLLDLIDLDVRQKNYPQAMSQVDKLEKVYPGTAIADVTRGGVYLASGKAADAISSFDKGVAEGASNPALMVNYYRAYQALGTPEKGIAKLEGWLESHQDDMGVRNVLAGAYLQDGQYDQAISAYQTLLSANPDNPQTLNNLAWLYQQKNNPKALEMAEKAHNLVPESPEIIDTYAWLLLNSGKKAQALELLKKAVALKPNHPEIRYHYASALNANGKTADARRELQDLMATGEKFHDYEDARKLLDRLR